MEKQLILKQSNGLQQGLFGLGICLAIAAVASSLVIGQTIKSLKNGPGTIYVKGKAERQISSDFAKWQGNLSVTAETLTKAYDLLEKDMQTLTQYLHKAGIMDEELTLSSVSISTNYQRNEEGNFTNVIESYSLSQDFAVNSTDITKVASLAQNITILIKEGLKVVSYQPQYFYTKLEELKVAMLGEASRDALLRAKELVKVSGSSVGKLRSAQQGVFQITSTYSTSFSDYGEYDTSSIEKVIKAVVTMEYAID